MTEAGGEAGSVLVQATSLRVARGRRDVLRDVTLTVRTGEILAILGPNGAGKSTLIETLGGQLKASSGELRATGRIATAMQAPEFARRTAAANIELALTWWGVARSERSSRTAEALDAMKASYLADRPTAAMSGGERRRVHLARAIALRPDVLLLDEPFAGLDPEGRAALLDDTASALRTSAQAVVLVVHDRTEAWALADRLVVLIAGRVAAEGPPQTVLEHPASVEVARFLGFNGQLRQGSEIVLTRPKNVSVAADGDIDATVTSVIPLEDGARAELTTADGTVWALVSYPGPTVGERLKIRVIDGVRFPAPPHIGSGP